MAEPLEFARRCRACGSKNEAIAKRCAACGADLDVPAEPPDGRYIDDDPTLRYVDPENRAEITRFEREDEAQLACGLLRFNRIPCQLSGEIIPGLPSDIILWTHNKDAQLAWALLADAEREARSRGQ